jgi:HlyD family secretion protein
MKRVAGLLAAGGFLLLLVGNSRVSPQERAAGPVKTPEPAKKATAPPTTAAALEKASAPATVKVQKQTFRVELNWSGTLEPAEYDEIAHHPYPLLVPLPTQGPLVLRQIVEHGKRVRKGDLLAAFDTRKMDQALQDTEVDLQALEAALRLAEEELPLADKAQPLELAAAERARKQAEEDLKYFLDVDRDQEEKTAHFMVKVARFYVEYAEEELRQLEKMYKASDLTEDTEQIILRRQRNRVEIERFLLREVELRRDYLLRYALPRREVELRHNLAKQELELAKARNTFSLQLLQKREALVKQRHERDKLRKRLELLRKERDEMTLYAPRDGIVYHGRFQHGQWLPTGGSVGRLVPEATVSPGEVFLTVAAPRPLQLRIQVEEKDLQWLKVGLRGKARLPTDPDHPLPAHLTALSLVPVAAGKYEAQVTVDLPAEETRALPGMSCKLTFVPYVQKEVLVLACDAVVEEDEGCYVTVRSAGGKQERRQVQLGRRYGGQVEIRAGLREGEEVVSPNPERAKSALSGG